MKTAEEYHQALLSQGFGDISFEITTIPEAKQALATIRIKQKQLRQFKQEINLDMKTIRAEYQQRMSTAGAGSSAVLTMFGKRGLAGSARASAKNKLRDERDRRLAPYDNLKLVIDKLLLDMDQSKAQISAWIAAAQTDAKE